MKKPVKLNFKKSMVLVPSPPFNFDATFFKPDHFTSGDNLCRKGTRWQSWRHQGVPLGLKFQNAGSPAKPKIRLNIHSNKNLSKGFLDSLIGEIRYFYNFDLNLKEFYRLFGSDKKLAPVIKRMRGMRPGQPSSLYEYLIIGIVLQNASVRRSIQMFKNLLENLGVLLEFDKKQFWCFWNPGGLHKVTEEKLRKLKLGYRAKSIKRLDEQFHKGMIDEIKLRREPLETQKKELLSLYGVGPATVWYILFDVFHHWDVFDHISPWEQKIYSKLFFNQDGENPVPVKKLLRFIGKYGKFKHLAVHYFWEDLWWRHKKKSIAWLAKEIRA
ncbi:TPA: hypothetical protein DEX28_01120 [Patescibacteria group bacterium]|nr:hypothetical protein [Patescibacteria group bacterium]